MLSRRSSAAASRWLRRRNAEGTASTSSDAVDALRDNLSSSSSSSSSASSETARALPAAIFDEEIARAPDHQHHQRDVLLQQCLPCLSNCTSSSSDFSTALTKYLVLTTRLVVSDSATLASSSSSSGSNQHWLHALSFFLDSISSQRKSNRSFRTLAFDSSPDWGAAWILLCRETLLVPSNKKQQQQYKNSNSSSSLAALSLCSAVTTAILPLANDKMQSRIRSQCSARVEAMQKAIKADSLELDASVQRAAGNYAAVLRVFLLAFKSASPHMSLGTAAEEAALLALKRLLVQKSATADLLSSSVSLGELLLGDDAGQKSRTSASLRTTIDRSFQLWCGASAGPALIMAADLCAQQSTTATPIDPSTVVALGQMVSNIRPASSTMATPESAAASTSTSAIVSTLCRYITPFGEMSSGVGSGGGVGSDHHHHHELKSVAPFLAASAALLSRSVAGVESARAWRCIASVLSGGGDSFSSSGLLEPSAATAVSVLASLISQIQHSTAAQKQQQQQSLLFARRTADALRVCLVSVALQLIEQQQEMESPDCLEPLLSVALQLDASGGASHQSSSSSSASSHVASLLLARARALQQAVPIKTLSDTARVQLAHHALGLPEVAVHFLREQMTRHCTTGGEQEQEQLFSAHSKWLLGGGHGSKMALAAVTTPETWQSCIRAFSHLLSAENGSSRSLVAAALASNAMWREALSLCDPAEAQRLCRQLLDSSNSADSSSSSSSGASWQLAVSLLTEMSSRRLTLRPATLVSLLRTLNSSSTPEDVSVNMTIQMSRPGATAATEEKNKKDPQENEQQQQVVNLLVSVTRAVVHSTAETAADSNDADDESGAAAAASEASSASSSSSSRPNPLLQARVFALSSLLASSQQQQQQQRRVSGGGGGRIDPGRLAGSLRAAMLLCADSGDWSSALYLISTVATTQQQQQNRQQQRDSSSPPFTLAPDVVWKVTRALEAAGQGHRVDELRRYVAAQDVSRWLSSDSADENLEETVPLQLLQHQGRSILLPPAQDDDAARADASQQLFDGIHVAEFIRLRSSAVQKLAAIGKWRTAASILSAMSQRLTSSAVKTMIEKGSNAELIGKAIAAAIFVCATRHHWTQALRAFALHEQQKTQQQQQQRHQNRFLPLPASLALIRSLSRAGRWEEAVSVFGSSSLAATSSPLSSASSSSSKYRLAVATRIFTNLTRACRVSRSWLSALRLHNARPSLVSFASASEVVAACSVAGFPLTKIQLWLNIAESNLFLVSTSAGAASVESDAASEDKERQQQSSISALDVSVFFALLNAQSYGGGSVIRTSGGEQQQQQQQQEQDAWKKSLELLHSCWAGNKSSAAAFEAAREPDCVASVIDTCIRQGQWHRAFALYQMQRLLLIPSTSHSVFLLLTAMLDRVSSSSSSSSATATTTTTSPPFTWKSAMSLVSDAVQRSSSSSKSVLQPMVCERLVQVLSRGGAWQRALDFAMGAGPSMGNLMTNDRVLDSVVSHSGNAGVVCRAAQASGTFPVAAQHSFGEKVVAAVEELLVLSDPSEASSASWQLALTTLRKCIKRLDNIPPRVTALAHLARLRRCCSSSSASSRASRGEIEGWLSLHDASSSSNGPPLSPAVACDVAFAKLSLLAMRARRKQHPDEDQLLQSAESLLRYSVLFGIPTKGELVDEWPRRLASLLVDFGGDPAVQRIAQMLRGIADEMP